MINEFICPCFFLGANSPKGFFAYLDNIYSPEQGWFCYIIKGGPGTGKSSLMKKIAKLAIENNINVEILYCSSDPNSLDCVILSDLKKCIIDGTAPHTMEPKFPGVSDTIINFCDFWDYNSLYQYKNEILLLSKKNSIFHQRANRYLSACGIIYNNNNKLIRTSIHQSKINNFLSNFSKKLFSNNYSNNAFNENIRFLSGITPSGLIRFDETISKICKDIYVIDDEYSEISNIIMSKIRKDSLKYGFNITTCYNPLEPTSSIEALIIPKLNTALITSSYIFSISPSIVPNKIIHTKRFLDPKIISTKKQYFKFNKKIIKELINEAIDNISKAKSIHDELEEKYIQSMDFNLINSKSEDIIKNILK